MAQRWEKNLIRKENKLLIIMNVIIGWFYQYGLFVDNWINYDLSKSFGLIYLEQTFNYIVRFCSNQTFLHKKTYGQRGVF